MVIQSCAILAELREYLLSRNVRGLNRTTLDPTHGTRDEPRFPHGVSNAANKCTRMAP